MNKPENKMLLAVLEKKGSSNGTDYYSAFMGLNSITASVKGDKIFIELVKWPKKEMAGNIEIQPLANETDVPF